MSFYDWLKTIWKITKSSKLVFMLDETLTIWMRFVENLGPRKIDIYFSRIWKFCSQLQHGEPPIHPMKKLKLFCTISNKANTDHGPLRPLWSWHLFCCPPRTVWLSKSASIDFYVWIKLRITNKLWCLNFRISIANVMDDVSKYSSEIV